MRGLALVVAILLSSCDLVGPDCTAVPGPDVEPGLYTFESLWVWPEGTSASGQPYADAEGMTVELSNDRSSATIRYTRDGVEIEEAWRIVIVG